MRIQLLGSVAVMLFTAVDAVDAAVSAASDTFVSDVHVEEKELFKGAIRGSINSAIYVGEEEGASDGGDEAVDEQEVTNSKNKKNKKKNKSNNKSGSCPSGNDKKCKYDPFNPLVCGSDYSCSYNTICDAEAAGFNVNNQCCQAPQPSACTYEFDPKECGSKKCPYANMCLAKLAGYSSSQCKSPPPTCPKGSANCSGEPSNPFLCGINRCAYKTICDAESAGFDIRNDCCQDTRTTTACAAIYDPVSCGPPGGKQCAYDNQCTANAAGYNAKQCCGVVPNGVACTMNYEPVKCGSVPCVYSNQCMADAAGYSKNQCCRQPPENTACPFNYAPVMCGSAKCVYENECIANKSGYDYNSCVPVFAFEH